MSKANCSRCRDDFVLEDMLKCTVQGCNNILDYTCAQLLESTFRRMGKKKDTWRCLDCRGNKSGEDERENDQIVVLRSIFKEFKDDLTSKFGDLERSVQYQSGKLDEVLTSFREMKKSFGEMQSRQEEIIKENQTLKKTVIELEAHVRGLDQKALDHNLEVNGIPESLKEEKTVMEAICAAVKVKTPAPEGYTLKRSFGGAPGKPKAVIISFEYKKERDGILKAAKKCKPRGCDLTRNPADVQPVFVNEQLTPYMKDLFFKALNIKKEKNFRYLWISDGKILVKKTDTAKVLLVREIGDMEK